MQKNLQKKPSFTTRNRLPLGIVVVCLVALILYGTFAHQTNIWPFQTDAQNTDQLTQNNSTDNPSPKNNNATPKTTEAPATKGETSNQVPISPDFVATINQLDEANNQITFNATVTNTTSAGICVLTFTNPNDRPVTKQFNATNQGNVSTCATTLSAYEFSYLGQWQVTFRYYVGNQQATAQSTIEIQ